MKVYEIDDTEFKDALIWAIYNGDSGRRLNLHMSDIIYSMINAFKNKLMPTMIEDLMMDREAHYKNVIRWMYGRGVDTGVSSVMQPEVGDWMHKNEVRIGGGIGHIDLYFQGMPYELKTSRYPYKRDLPYSHAIKQLSYYMAGNNDRVGRVKVFDMLPLDERTWALELTKKDIKARRSIVIRKFALLRRALLNGDWSTLPESKLSWMTRGEVDTLEFLEENKSLVRRSAKKWAIEFKAVQDAKRISRTRRRRANL